MKLSDQVEAAAGPDRELDALIAEAINGHPPPRSGGGQNALTGKWYEPNEPYCPAYSASIDAALTLVPEECLWNLKMEYTEGRGLVRMWYPNSNSTYQSLHTPALALCAAALRARGL